MAYLAILLSQLMGGESATTGSWFLVVALAVLLIGGVLLLVHGFIDLRREHAASDQEEREKSDRKKAA